MADISFDDLIPDSGVDFDDLIPAAQPAPQPTPQAAPARPQINPTSVSRMLGQFARGALPTATTALAGATAGAPAGPPGIAAGALLGGVALPIADAINTVYNMGARAVGADDYQIGMPSQAVLNLLDKYGLTTPPRNQPERIAGTVGSAVAGVGTQVPAAARLATEGATQLGRNIGAALAAAPKTQAAVAPTAAIAGQKVAEDTDSPLAGLAASIFTGAVTGKITSRSGGKEINSNTLKAQANAAYKSADDAGVVVKSDSVNAIRENVRKVIKEEGYDPDLHPGLNVILKRLATKEGDMTLSEIERTRRVLLNVVRTKGDNYDQQRIAGDALQALDDGIVSLSQKNLVSGKESGISSLTKARELWRRKAKTEIIEDVIERAKLQSENYSQSGMENALRQQFKGLYNNKNRLRQFNKEERQLIRKAATGGPLITSLRYLGKFSPRGVLSFGVGTGTGFVAGAPFGAGPVGALVLPTAGAASQATATMLRQGRAKDVMRAVSGGQRLAPKNANVRPAMLRSILSNPTPGLLSE